jgi:Mn-dependent DtxR family transcriptional regulator
MQDGLTPRQQQLLDAIKKFIVRNRYPPSHRDLAVDLDCSHHTVQEILRYLIAKGYVEYTPGVRRSLRVGSSGQVHKSQRRAAAA